MAQYQILARKPLGPSGTGPKQTLEVKTVSQHRLEFAARRCTAACTACGTGPHATRATTRNSCRWAAGGAQHRARQSRTVAGQRAQWATLETTHNAHNPSIVAASLPPQLLSRRPSPRAAAAAVCRRLRGWTCSDHLDEEIPSVINSSRLLVKTDEGAVIPVVDRIRRTQPPIVEVPVSL
ncbi:hypothetical protein F511_24719 [Dorcoceras hygrometricum]|uniref:Uncharacterized protein n=1 Tax=Dorcoceras hygrometricum TaxID=472368 RepID=A0A2Z7BZK0_9LAMI|nr:hypothetical protein F511_24719 [Dorcoceras hygrometricum]